MSRAAHRREPRGVTSAGACGAGPSMARRPRFPAQPGGTRAAPRVCYAILAPQNALMRLVLPKDATPRPPVPSSYLLGPLASGLRSGSKALSARPSPLRVRVVCSGLRLGTLWPRTSAVILVAFTAPSMVLRIGRAVHGPVGARFARVSL